MLKQLVYLSLLLFGVLQFVACEKPAATAVTPDLSTVNNNNSVCQQSCTLVPYRDWCWTGAATYYYFNATTGQCEPYAHRHGTIPFQTLQDCQACDCGNL